MQRLHEKKVIAPSSGRSHQCSNEVENATQGEHSNNEWWEVSRRRSSEEVPQWGRSKGLNKGRFSVSRLYRESSEWRVVCQETVSARIVQGDWKWRERYGICLSFEPPDAERLLRWCERIKWQGDFISLSSYSIEGPINSPCDLEMDRLNKSKTDQYHSCRHSCCTDNYHVCELERYNDQRNQISNVSLWRQYFNLLQLWQCHLDRWCPYGRFLIDWCSNLICRTSRWKEDLFQDQT